jgi:hypothetical protein
VSCRAVPEQSKRHMNGGRSRRTDEVVRGGVAVALRPEHSQG